MSWLVTLLFLLLASASSLHPSSECLFPWWWWWWWWYFHTLLFGKFVSVLKLSAGLCQMCENLNLLLHLSIFGFFQSLVLFWRKKKLAACSGLYSCFMFLIYFLHSGQPCLTDFIMHWFCMTSGYLKLRPLHHSSLWAAWNFIVSDAFSNTMMAASNHRLLFEGSDVQ